MCTERDDNSTDEIEITPEMIKGARAAYDAWYATTEGDTGPLDNMFASVFRAMARLQEIRVFRTSPLILGRHIPDR
jgi:hypothetical protein